jgi:hypothetical protein
MHCVRNGARQRSGASSKETLSASFARDDPKTAAEGKGFQKPSWHRVVHAFRRRRPAGDAALAVLFPREKGQEASAAAMLLHNSILRQCDVLRDRWNIFVHFYEIQLGSAASPKSDISICARRLKNNLK